MQNIRFQAPAAADSADRKASRDEMEALSEELGDILRWTWTTSVQKERDDAIRRLISKTQRRSQL